MSSTVRPELKILGQSLADLRVRAKLSQQQVANYLGLSRHTVSQHEAGRREPTIGDICRLANLYSSSLAEVFFPLEQWVPPTLELSEVTVTRVVRRSAGEKGQ